VTDFDIEGVDYYPSNYSGTGGTGKTFAFLQSNLTALANTNTNNGTNSNPSKKIMLLETNYPYMGTANSSTEPISNYALNNYPNTPNNGGSGSGNPWPATTAGQQQEFTDVRNLMEGLPGGDGEGLLWWYPEAVQVNPYTINNGGDTALFNTAANNYAALPILSPTTGAFNVTGTITATWVKNQDADWNTAGNWLGGAIPNGVGAEADLLSTITAAHTLSSGVAVTLGSLYLNNANSYTIGGSGSLTMQVSSGSALVEVLSGSHTINLPMTIASNTTISVASGASLSITAPLAVNSGLSLTPSGSGPVNYQSSITLQSAASITFANSFHSTGLSLTNSSSAKVLANGTGANYLVQFDLLSFGGSKGAWEGKLDLSNNDMIVHNAAGSLADITSQIAEGYGTGTWNGAGGIISSAAVGSGNTSLGVELNDNGSGGTLLSMFDGQTVTNTDVLVKYTYVGDADLDGVINGSDYTLIDNGFNSQSSADPLSGWRNGDFNYDGVINGDDYLLIDNAFNTQTGALAVGVSPDEQIAVLPEPAATGSVIFAAAIFVLRNRSWRPSAKTRML
jgi:hypothetical protein